MSATRSRTARCPRTSCCRTRDWRLHPGVRAGYAQSRWSRSAKEPVCPLSCAHCCAEPLNAALRKLVTKALENPRLAAGSASKRLRATPVNQNLLLKEMNHDPRNCGCFCGLLVWLSLWCLVLFVVVFFF